MGKPAAEPLVSPQALVSAVARLIGPDAAHADRFGIAVSGGPDSMALLSLAASAFPARVSAATVDHRLRAESAAEAQMVAEHCQAATIDHHILTPDQPITGTLQASARAARYALLESWRTAQGIDWLMTAHHADDQLETLVMRINRGSGVGGLAGVRARQGRVLRPLLGFRRQALSDWCVQDDLPTIADPSNENERYDRARIRASLAGQALVDPLAVSESAGLLDQADRALDWAVDRLMDDHYVAADGGVTLHLPALPEELARRLLLRALAALEPGRAAPRRRASDHALAEVHAGRQAMLGDVLLSPMKDGELAIRLTRAPPRRSGQPE